MRISKLRKGMLILASAIVKRCIAIDRRLVRDCKNVYVRLLSLNLVVTIFGTHAYSVIKMISQRHQGYCPIGYLSPFLFIPFPFPFPSFSPFPTRTKHTSHADKGRGRHQNDIRTTSKILALYLWPSFPFSFPFSQLSRPLEGTRKALESFRKLSERRKAQKIQEALKVGSRRLVPVPESSCNPLESSGRLQTPAVISRTR